MTTALTLPTNAIDINKAFGFSSDRPKPEIPSLKVNGTDDDDGTSAPKGTFVYDDGDRVLYAQDVTIRTFLKGMQYRMYHPKDKLKNDVSIIGNSFRVEFRSTSGKIACGKLSKKKYEELGAAATTEQKELQDLVKCKLLIFGLVSGKFTNLDTKEDVVVKDELFVWVTSQSAFMPMDQAISGIEKERRPVPCTPIRIKLKKEKNGSVTYYVPMPDVLNEVIPLNGEVDLANLEKIKNYVTSTNKYVEGKYNEALKSKTMDADFASVGTTIEAKAVVADDEIPF